MRILTRSYHSDLENAHPQLPRPESSSAKVKQRRNLGDGGYTLTSDRREMVTVAMRNGFAWAQRWELETSGPFTLSIGERFNDKPVGLRSLPPERFFPVNRNRDAVCLAFLKGRAGGSAWYLEDYLVAPYAVYEERGQQIHDRLRKWGEALFDSLFGAGKPGRDLYLKAEACLN